MKDITNADNPLVVLMKLSKTQKNSKSVLVRDLIKLVCEKIKMTRKELMDDTFEKPKRPTLIYCILFDEAFVTQPVRVTTIEQLSGIWKKWETDGFLVHEISMWNNLARAEQETVCRIWNTVTSHLKSSIEFDRLIEQAKVKIGMIKEMIENVNVCIKELCQNASDRDICRNQLEELEQQLNNLAVNMAIVTPAIEELGIIAGPIKLFISSPHWREYIEIRLQSQAGMLRSFPRLISTKPFLFRTSKQP